MSDGEHDVLALLLKVLDEATTPLKASEIAQILEAELKRPVNKRDLNPALYRLAALGRLRRDSLIRWISPYAKLIEHDAAPAASGLVPGLANAKGSRSSTTASKARIPEKNIYVRAQAAGLEAAAETRTQPDTGRARQNQPMAKYGPLRVNRDRKRYERHCNWCARKIPAGAYAVVAQGYRNKPRRFCRTACFDSWESIYWQRIELGKRGLSKREFDREQRIIKREQRILGYGWN